MNPNPPLPLTIDSILERLPEIQPQLHPNQVLHIVGLASNDARRHILNQKLNLGGIKFPHHQYSADGKVLFNTFVYPVEMHHRVFRGRTNLMIVYEDSLNLNGADVDSIEALGAMNRGLLSVANILKLTSENLHFPITL